MSKACIFIEGGGSSMALRTSCRAGFRNMLDKSGFEDRPAHLVACGSRADAYRDFKIEHGRGRYTYVALLVDSEDPISDVEQTWQHLKMRDKWERPAGATDDQVFLMTTCMETWIVADRTALNSLYRNCLQESALPSLTNLEQKDRHVVQDSLVHATRNCTNAYAKNKHSFGALANAEPSVLKAHLPSFARMVRILDEKLQT